ncbi:MAG: 2,4-dihydroxyhept-2-ene-1,7-dioic acid aldolase [Firmicutes bacterium]|nr:2,4-dihydroxyhept-2-ene-1,7-dioic acid aldolase [Bacillota bacterium]
MNRENKVKKKMENGEVSIGIYATLPSADIVELAGLCGMDYVRIDCHHGAIDLETVGHMIRAAELTGMTPFVRVYNEPQRILSVLDLGALGIIVPDIHSADDARRAVESVHYAPLGDRGLFSNCRSSDYGLFPGKQYIEWAAQNTMIGLQIENKDAIDNIEEILSVPGIDFIMSGRNDLSQSLGVGGDKTHPLVLAAEQKISDAANKAGVTVALNMNPFSGDVVENTKKLLDKGSKMITLGTDIGFIMNNFREVAGKVKSAI